MLFSLLQVLKGKWKNFGLKKFIKNSVKKIFDPKNFELFLQNFNEKNLVKRIFGKNNGRNYS